MDSLLQVNSLLLHADWTLSGDEFSDMAVQAPPGVLSADGIDGFPNPPMSECGAF